MPLGKGIQQEITHIMLKVDLKCNSLENNARQLSGELFQF